MVYPSSRDSEFMKIRPSLSGIYRGEVPGRDRVTVRPSIYDDLRLEHQFSCLVNGPNGSGKSSFCIRFLQNHGSICTVHTFYVGVIWFHTR